MFIDTDALHTLHGRAIAVATVLKLAAPERKVVVFTGDGRLRVHRREPLPARARRNLDLTVIMMNNEIYGMTGGQVAPTTPFGSRTQTSPHGNPEPMIDACELARVAGATMWPAGPAPTPGSS